MVKIIEIRPGSIAEELGIEQGDRVVSVNHKKISDALDYKFYITSEEIELEIQQGEEHIVYEIEKEYDDDLGLQLEDLELRACGNACIFCFVFQNVFYFYIVKVRTYCARKIVLFVSVVKFGIELRHFILVRCGI